ncbi:hypothetical protein [Xanthovirga aplysinae]|uniref:hypothetical protein n=1 Tax=Xanthovirga aplysinae TaxID=2529853 RepID=UPI0012BC4B71|nr:hypothetical protein [Xanthovirga aplysinae]MTI29879.1 hypothetical protein [Xanthovirga aplysinae]
MRGRVICGVILLLICVRSVRAQIFPSQIWHEGMAVLNSRDTLEGLIKYNLEKDLIQIKTPENLIKTFSSSSIFHFQLFDKSVGLMRYFYAIPYKVKRNYRVPILFELLFEGNLSLLCRETIVQESVNQYGYYSYSGGYTARNHLFYTFYFLDKEGVFHPYKLKKKEFIKVFHPEEEAVLLFMKKYKLRNDRKDDLIEITEYFNSIEK